MEQLRSFLKDYEKRQRLVDAQVAELVKETDPAKKTLLERWIQHNRKWLLEREAAYRGIKENISE